MALVRVTALEATTSMLMAAAAMFVALERALLLLLGRYPDETDDEREPHGDAVPALTIRSQASRPTR